MILSWCQPGVLEPPNDTPARLDDTERCCADTRAQCFNPNLVSRGYRIDLPHSSKLIERRTRTLDRSYDPLNIQVRRIEA